MHSNFKIELWTNFHDVLLFLLCQVPPHYFSRPSLLLLLLLLKQAPVYMLGSALPHLVKFGH